MGQTSGVSARTPFLAFEPLAVTAAAGLFLACLAACDGAPSAVPARPHAGAAADRRLADGVPGAAGAETRAPASYGDAGRQADRAAAPREAAPLFHGKPIWAANRNHTAQENADYHFKRDGEALGAATEEEFLTKVHAFVHSPPAGTETLTRANGDRLLYDAKANLFAVVDKDGAPRTLFKPRDGAAYWRQQKDSLAETDDRPRTRRSARRSGAPDDEG